MPAQNKNEDTATRPSVTTHPMQCVELEDPQAVQGYVHLVRPAAHHHAEDAGKLVFARPEEYAGSFQVKVDGHPYAAFPYARKLDLGGHGWLILVLVRTPERDQLRLSLNIGKERQIYVAVGITNGHVSAVSPKLAAARKPNTPAGRSTRSGQIARRLLGVTGA